MRGFLSLLPRSSSMLPNVDNLGTDRSESPALMIGRHSSISCFDAEAQADREVCTKSGSPDRVFMGFRLLPVPLRRMIREH